MQGTGISTGRVRRFSEGDSSPFFSPPFSADSLSWVLRKLADTAEEFGRYSLATASSYFKNIALAGNGKVHLMSLYDCSRFLWFL